MSEFLLFEREPQPTAVVRATIPVSQIPAFLGRAYVEVMQALRVHGIAPAGPPFAYYLGMPTATVEMEAGFPVATPCGEYGDVVPSELPGGSIASTMHVGPYERMVETYNALMQWMTEHELAPGQSMWEIYLSDPRQEPDSSKWETQVFWPVTPAHTAVPA
jgi:effector-binding domain-containing protein